MARTFTKKINKVELVKIEKVFNNPSLKQRYIYNFHFDGIDEPLIVENTNVPLPAGIEGHKIKYVLNSDNEIIEFDIL